MAKMTSAEFNLILVTGSAGWLAIIAGIASGTWKRAVWRGIFLCSIITLIGNVAGLIVGGLVAPLLGAIYAGFGYLLRRIAIGAVAYIREFYIATFKR